MDLIDRQAAIDEAEEWIEAVYCDREEQRERSAIKKVIQGIKCLPSAQPEIVRCKDCKYWVPGYITDNDDFIPPKCGEWQQMVGHSSDDYCSLAERRKDG